MRTATKVSIAVALATLRIMGHKSQAFQAVAHLFVGGLFAAAYVRFDSIESETDESKYAPLVYENLTIAVVLSLIELGCFLWQKFVG